MSFRVGTFNIHHGRGRDGVLDLARTAASIRALDAGLVALQEVDVHLSRSGRVDQARALAEAAGMHGVFSTTLTIDDGSYGLLLLTDRPVEVDFVPLPRAGREEPRGMQMSSWCGLTVIATHLAVGGEARLIHTRALADAAASATAPVLVLGDLNQDRRTLGPLAAAGFDPGPVAATFGRRQIDFVLAGPGTRVVSAHALRSEASDHRPLAAEIDLEPT